eukprot:2176596-Rhodomonas_salina.2
MSGTMSDTVDVYGPMKCAVLRWGMLVQGVREGGVGKSDGESDRGWVPVSYTHLRAHETEADL